MSFMAKSVLVDHNIGGWKTQELEIDSYYLIESWTSIYKELVYNE